MSVSQILVVASLYSFITVIIITNCQTYDHQWMHNVWSGFRSDNDDWIISDIHKPDQQESSSQPPSANWFWYIIEPTLYRIHILRTEIYKMHNHWQASGAKTLNPIQLFWILIDDLKAYGPLPIQVVTNWLSITEISDNRVVTWEERHWLKLWYDNLNLFCLKSH